MTVKHFLKSAIVGIAVAGLVLILGVAGQMAWVVTRSPSVHETSGKVLVASSASATIWGSTMKVYGGSSVSTRRLYERETKLPYRGGR
jgi:hypothetical protein